MPARYTPLTVAFAALIATSFRAAIAQTPPIDFAHDVAPILKAHCAKCHANGKKEGELSLDTREALLAAEAVVPGKSAESELYRRITSSDALERMPSKGPALPDKDIATIKAWIDAGAPWEPGFTFAANTYTPPLKPRRPEIPSASPGLEHPIDRILQPYLATHDVKLTAVNDATFVRRAYLDVIGLLPAASETQAFVADTSTDKRTQLVARLLGEKRGYADHWLSFWNDLLRNDYQGTGYIDGGRKQITDWLYKSLVDNKPYDVFVRELITPVPEAAGFIEGIKWRGSVNASQVREIQFSQNVSQVFFGVNMKCASCHDSFIDSWKLDDAYGLAAVISDAPLEIARCDKATGRIATPHFLFPELGDIDAALPKADRLRRMAELVTHADNGRFTRTIVNRIWERLFGRGIVHPVDIMANPPWNEDLLDYLAVYLVDQNYDLKALIAHIMQSRAYQAGCPTHAAATAASDYVFRGPEAKRMTAEQWIDAIWMMTGAGPKEPATKTAIEPFAPTVPAERQFIRAALVTSDPLQRSLGRPNREQVVTTRADELTTLQALDLENGEIVDQAIARGASRCLEQNAAASRDDLIQAVFLQALSRSATAAELETAREIVGDHPSVESVADLLWTIFMLPEFQLIR